jgi:hypothetical protein
VRAFLSDDRSWGRTELLRRTVRVYANSCPLVIVPPAHYALHSNPCLCASDQRSSIKRVGWHHEGRRQHCGCQHLRFQLSCHCRFRIPQPQGTVDAPKRLGSNPQRRDFRRMLYGLPAQLRGFADSDVHTASGAGGTSRHGLA